MKDGRKIDILVSHATWNGRGKKDPFGDGIYGMLMGPNRVTFWSKCDTFESMKYFVEHKEPAPSKSIKQITYKQSKIRACYSTFIISLQ